MLGITIKTVGMPALPRRERNRIRKALFFIIGKGWHDRYSRDKFTPRAARKYGYARRHTKEITTGRVKTSRRGQPRAPSGNPLTWSGRSRLLARRRRVRATSRGVRVTSPVRAFNFKPPHNPGLDMRKEYTSVTVGDQRTLEKDASAKSDRLYRQSNVRTTVRIGAV